MSRAQLFTPFRVGGLELRNRIVIAPMCQYSADEGRATDWHVIHLGHLALSGAALLTIEATDPKFDRGRTAEFLKSLGAKEVNEVED